MMEEEVIEEIVGSWIIFCIFEYNWRLKKIDLT